MSKRIEKITKKHRRRVERLQQKYKRLAQTPGAELDYENFSTYSLDDPNGRLVIDPADTMTFTSVRRSDTCKLRRALSIPTSYVYIFTFMLIGISQSEFTQCYIYATNNSSTGVTPIGNDSVHVYISWKPACGSTKFSFYLEGNFASVDAYNLDLNTQFWVKMVRNLSTTECRIYDNEEMSSLVTTLNVSNTANTFSYIWVMNSATYPGKSQSITGWLKELDIYAVEV